MSDQRADLDRTEDDVRGERARRVLDELTVEGSTENVEMMKVYLQAFEIFLERNRRHRAQWRVGGIQGLLVDLRKKAERTWNEWMLSVTKPNDVDSFVDLINYAAFAVQAVKEGQRGQQVGTWTWPQPSGTEGRRATSSDVPAQEVLRAQFSRDVGARAADPTTRGGYANVNAFNPNERDEEGR
jgi:hypothetical protein